MRIKDEESRQELEEERRGLQLKLDRMKSDAEKLDLIYRKRKAEHEKHVKTLTNRNETAQNWDRDSGSSNNVRPSLDYEQPNFDFDRVLYAGLAVASKVGNIIVVVAKKAKKQITSLLTR